MDYKDGMGFFFLWIFLYGILGIGICVRVCGMGGA
jgi:hypothetical protein